MRRLIFFSITFIILLAGFGVTLKGTVSQTWFIPGAAETTGLNGAQFSSTLYLTNSGDTSADVQIGFIPYAGKPVPAPVNRSIVAGGTIRIEHCLQTLFKFRCGDLT
ncbi:MAG: hypothetical protein U0V70_00465 [Terriglobia bacterium]